MPVPVPFGQYLPGSSAIHRLDARTKIVLAASTTVVLFATDAWWVLGAVAAAVLAGFAVSRVPVRLALRGLRPIAVLLAFTLVVNAVRRVDVGVSVAGWGWDGDGALIGLYFALRIVLLVAATSLMTYTTSPVALTDALVSFMRPLSALGVPVEDVAMMMSIALRFIPTTAEEAEKIRLAQASRGARFDQGGPVARAKAWVPVLVPLFVSLFRRADDLAFAMESRCYTGTGRTRLRQPRFTATDALVTVCALCASAACVLLG